MRSGIPRSQSELIHKHLTAWSRGWLGPPFLSERCSWERVCNLSLRGSPFSPILLSGDATVRMGEGHIPQLVPLSTLLPGGVSQFLSDIFSSSACFSNTGSVIAFTCSTLRKSPVPIALLLSSAVSSGERPQRPEPQPALSILHCPELRAFTGNASLWDLWTTAYSLDWDGTTERHFL